MLRYIIGISLIAILIMIVRAISDGKIQRRHQYALWLFIPLYMVVSPFLSINVPVNESVYSALSIKDNYVSARDENVLKPIVPSETIQFTTYTTAGGDIDAEKQAEVITTDTDEYIVQTNTKGAKKLSWEAVLPVAVYGVSALLITALIIYNVGFIMYCRKRRNYIFRDQASGLKIYSIKNSETPFLLFNKIYVDDEPNLINKYVICHEASHYKHLDFIWISLRYLVLALNWYNPIIWAAFILSGKDCELACDEEVLNVLGQDSSIEYSRVLLRLIEKQNRFPFGFALSTEMRGEFESIKKRITSIKQPAKNSYKMLVLCMVTVILFSSCAFIKPAPVNTDSFWYGCSSFSIPAVVGYHQYYCDSIYADGYYYLVLSGMKENEKIEGPDTFCKLYKIDSEGNGLITVSLPDKCSSPTNKLIVDDKLLCIDPNSNVEYMVDIKTGEIVSEKAANFNSYDFCLTDDGYVELTMDGIIRYSKDGVETGRIKSARYFPSFYQQDGKFYLIEDDGVKLVLTEADFEAGSFRKVFETNAASLHESEVKGDLVFTGKGVYHLDVKTRSYMPVTEWNYVDIKPGYKNTLNEMNLAYGNERFGRLYEYTDNEFELLIFNNIPADVYSNRQKITIGGYNIRDSVDVKWATYKFNTSQSKYRVFLDDYWEEYGYSSSEEAQAQTAKLIKHFNEGNGPDMYFGTSFDYRYLYNAGLLADMLPLIEKDPDFSLDDLVPSIKDTIVDNGVCYQIFSSYYFNGVFGRKSDFEGNDITYSGVDALAQIKGIPLQGDNDAHTFADQVIRNPLGDLMVRASGNHIISEQELKDVVDYSVRNGIPKSGVVTNISDLESVHNGTNLTCRMTYLGNVYGLNDYESNLNDSFVYLGFPSIYGSVHAADSDGIVAISSDSKNKEACWQFIKYMLSDEVQEDAVGQGHNPVINEIFEEHCKYAANPESVPENEIIWKSIVNGKKSVPEWVISDYRDMAYSIDAIISYDNGLFTIIRDEIDSYYLQNKSTDEIARTLQSRIDLYVSENYK